LITDLEKLRDQDVNEFKRALQAANQRIRTLEVEMDKEGRESSEMALLRQRLAEELEDEREQHQKDLEERDFTIDQTRKKYQGMLFMLEIFFL
jgi:myosin heavy chain 9/10/11/14